MLELNANSLQTSWSGSHSVKTGFVSAPCRGTFQFTLLARPPRKMINLCAYEDTRAADLPQNVRFVESARQQALA